MKTKILRCIISFIFFALIVSINTYAVTNETIELHENLEDMQKNEVTEEKMEEENYFINNGQAEIEELSEFIPSEIVDENVVYNGTMYLDNPTNNKTFIKPDENKIKIEGWAVSDDANATIRILIDGNIVANNVGRTKRDDVDLIISPNYGGASLTPNAGFVSEIDISHLNEGRHEIRVEEISRFGELIVDFVSEIQITNRRYQGTMYLGTPSNHQNFIMPEEAKMKVEGWAVSNDLNAYVRLLIDGNVISENMQRTKMEDVDILISPGYGGANLTPNAGFIGEIDISYLSQGRHEIRVEEISRFGDLIVDFASEIEITNRKYQGTMYLENPTYNRNFIKPEETHMKVEGWAVSGDLNATIRVLIDGNVVQNNVERTKRADVDILISPAYGGASLTPNAGFSGEIDISNLNAGNHIIRVEEISRFGDLIVAFEHMIQVSNKKYQGTMYLENPTYNRNFIKPDEAKAKLEGWAVSGDLNATIRVLIDGNVVQNNIERTKRADVDILISPAYGGASLTPNAGFSGEIDISNLNVGNHIVRVEEISRFGDLIVAFEHMIQISNKQYLGEMCIDSPTPNRQYNLGENIAVDGWAVAQDEYATVEIYVDGNFKAKAERYTRPDVVYFMNKYDGKTINAGFGKLINSSEIGSGTHTITVYEKSRYGDIIGGVEVQILIKVPQNTSQPTPTNPSSGTGTSSSANTSYNKPHIATSGTKGIDVSQFQGNINWKSVASSDVKYAMIRIGYRGYGTGGFAEDTKFKTNFSNAVANGLKVGVYFYSTAINTAEAQKDAEYVVSILKKYGYQNQVSMPIAIDLELVSGVNTRDKNVSKATRTNIANTFCQTIASYGYTPMVYACKSFLNDNMNASQIQYDVWVAQYNSKCTYNGKYTMWQYTSTGKVSGISGNVDCNICYKNY